MKFPEWISANDVKMHRKEWELIGFEISFHREAALVKWGDDLVAAYFSSVSPNGMRLKGWKRMNREEFSDYVLETNKDMTMKEALQILGLNLKFDMKKELKEENTDHYGLGA